MQKFILLFLFCLSHFSQLTNERMNPNRRSRSPSRFSPIDEHPNDNSLRAHSPKHHHSPQSNVQTAQIDFEPEKYDTYRSNGTQQSAANDPLSRRSSGFQNKGSKENLFNDPVVIPITHVNSISRLNSIPRLSVDVKTGGNNGNDEWVKHEVQVNYHNERTAYPAAYHHPMYYQDYGYNNRLQFPHQTMLSPSFQYHNYYPQPDYPMSPRSIRKGEHIVSNGTMQLHKNGTLPKPLPSPHQTNKSLKSQKSNTTKKQKIPKQPKPLKQTIYRKIHCCCFSCIWPPFAYEYCEPPQPMYASKKPKPDNRHVR